MSSLRVPSIPFDTNPRLAPGISALRAWLVDSDYSFHAIDRIASYAAREGTVTGCPELDPSDEAAAAAVFTDGLDCVRFDSPAWDDPSVYLDVESLLEPRVATLPPSVWNQSDPDFVAEMARHFEPPDAPDAGMSRSAALGELLRNGRVDALPPIAGGSPDFEPSAADLADYQEWAADLDRRRSEEEALDAVRQWYRDNEHTRPDFGPMA